MCSTLYSWYLRLALCKTDGEKEERIWDTVSIYIPANFV